MAASDARPMPRKNTAFRVTFPIFNSSGDLATGASGLDSEVSIDGGTFADCTNEATEIATSSGIYYLDLTADELNGYTVHVNVKSTGNKTTPITIYPESPGDIRVDVVQISGDATAADNLESFTDGTGYAGTNNVIPIVTTVTNLTNAPTNGDLTATMKASVTTAATAATPTVTAGTVSDKTGYSLATTPPTAAQIRTEMDSNSTQLSKIGTPAGASLAADVAAVKSETAAILTDTTEIGAAGAGLTALASAANLATLAGYVDTEVAAILSAVDTEVGAIKAVTDRLPDAGALTTITNNIAAILADTETDGVVLADGAITAAKIAANAIAAAKLAADALQAIADAVLSRSRANVDNTASTDSLYELIGAILDGSTATGDLVVKKTDGVTTFNTRPLDTDPDAVPIVGIGG